MVEQKLRPRRMRISEAVRSMVRETSLSVKDFVYPIFVVPGEQVREEIPSMPECYHLSVDNAVELAKEIYALGIPSVEVFGLPEYKDEIGSSAWDMTSPVQRAIKAIKEAVPKLVIVGDVCLCQYTSHGHCGKLCGEYVDNDATLELLQKVAVSQAKAGADIIAPSDMMDGRVAKRALSMFRSCPMQSNMLRATMDRSVMRQTRPRSSATAALIRWIRPMRMKPSRRLTLISLRVQTSSWSSRHWLIWTSCARCAIISIIRLLSIT